jgi:uncharacterized protein (DUF1778 family)
MLGGESFMGRTASTLEAKDTRLFVRCRTRDKDLIEQAAATPGMNVSDYILSTLIERSVGEMQRQNRITLTQAAFAQLTELMDRDPEPAPALAGNLKQYRKAVEAGTLSVAD